MNQGPYGCSRKTVWLISLLASAAVASAQTENLADGLESSLGQLCKRSRSIFTGKVESVTVTNRESLAIGLMGCSNLWGVSVAATNQVLADGSFGGTDGGLVPELGQSVLVFASPIPFDPANFQAYRWDYAEHFSEKSTTEPLLHVAGGPRGLIVLNNDSGPALFASIGQYWSHLRGNARNFDGYASFLTLTQTSAVERVRQDARRDLMLLIRFADKPTLRKLWQKGVLNEEGQTYLEEILSWKEKGEPANVRDLTPREDDLARWKSALKEPVLVNRLNALCEMLMPQRRAWMESASSRWREDVAILLSDTNRSVRASAALLLSHVQDQRAIPILIEMLRDQELGWRREVWQELKLKCGDRVTFDPDAPPAVREESIRAVENWYKEHHK